MSLGGGGGGGGQGGQGVGGGGPMIVSAGSFVAPGGDGNSGSNANSNVSAPPYAYIVKRDNCYFVVAEDGTRMSECLSTRKSAEQYLMNKMKRDSEARSLTLPIAKRKESK